MNKVSLNSKVSLLEIVLSALIFAVAGIIMLNSFAIARFTQVRANDKTLASSIIQSDLEIIKSLNSSDEMHEFLNEYYDIKDQDNNSYTYIKYFDENWKQGSKKEYSVTTRVSNGNSKSGKLIKISIQVEKEKPYPFIKKGQEIYSIESKKFFPDFGGDNDE